MADESNKEKNIIDLETQPFTALTRFLGTDENGKVGQIPGQDLLDDMQEILENSEPLQGYVAAATASKNAAKTSETNSKTSETNSKASEIAAELSASNALIAGGNYTTEAAGRAAVADGQAFRVQGSGDVAVYEYRRTNSTTSVLISTYPSAQKVNDNEIAVARSSQDVALYNGSMAFNSVAKTIVVTGGVMNRSGAYLVLNKTLDISATSNNVYGLYADPDNNWDLSLAAYNVNVAVTKKKQVCLARFGLSGTGGSTLTVYFCIAKTYSVNGASVDQQVNDAIIQGYSAKYTPYTDVSATLYNGLINFDSTTKLITITGGGVMNRGGAYVNLNNKTLDFSALGGGDYGLYAKPSDATLSAVRYTTNVSVTKAEEFCLARFTLSGGNITKIQSCISDFILNGEPFGRYVKQSLSNLVNVTTKRYVQIGDSISWQYDGKKENFRSENPTETGYRTIGGYGQKICKYFGIPYANHFSHGLNGRTFCEYMKDVNSPPNSDAVYQPPKDGDIYTILIGSNDQGKADPLGTKNDYLNNTLDFANFNTSKTIYGGLRKLVDYITDTTDNRDKKIVFITPIGFGAYPYGGVVTSTWQYDVNGEIIERPNSAGVKMSDIVTAIKWVANQIGASVIDLYGNQGLVQKQRLNVGLTMNGSNPAVYQGVLGDNLHPTLKGQTWLGNYIAYELEKIIVTDTF